MLRTHRDHRILINNQQPIVLIEYSSSSLQLAQYLNLTIFYMLYISIVNLIV
jgi:hypothetical protein